jgi:branched-chain amino acid transport system permease protein
VSFFVSLVVDGALAGVVYALLALAFVVIYRSARMINFALGEWVMLGALLVAFGAGTLRLGSFGAVGLAVAGLVALAFAFNHVVLDRLTGRPVITLIMATLGLSMLLRGAMAVLFGDTPRSLPFELPRAPLFVLGVEISAPKLAGGVISAILIAAMGWFLSRSRTGIALRALADDTQAAMAAGIDSRRHTGLTWALAGMVSVAAGVLWTLVSGGGGLGLQLLGLKVFPIVVIGGLDSIGGTLIAALIVGIVESLAAGYLGPVLGYGVGGIAACILLLAVLVARPYGLFGRARVERV